MTTIRALARRFGLSRTALLYYDRIGLLRPSARAPNGYRIYSSEDEARLAQICRYREAGLPLSRIRTLLGDAGDAVASALEQRLEELNREVAGLRRQQRVAIELLARKTARRSRRLMTKAGWIRLLQGVGLDETERHEWHRGFERQSPEAHQAFLESLGIPAAEIRAIRAWSRGGGWAPGDGPLPDRS